MSERHTCHHPRMVPTGDRHAAPIAVRVLAAAGLLVTVGAALAAVGLRIVDPVPVVQSTFGFTDLSLVSFGVLGVSFASVGALLMIRLPRNSVGWCMLLVGAAYALAALAAAATFSAVADGPSNNANAGIAAWSAVLFAMVGSLIFGLGFIFPTGHGPTPAWDRFLVIAAIALPFLIVIGFLVRPGPLQVFPTIDNPFGVGPDLRPIFGKQPSQTIASVSALVAPLVAWSMIVRYRRSDSIGRQQLKWFAVSLIAAVAGMVIAALASTLTDRPPEAGLAFFGFCGAMVPIAIGVAILRYRLYDIDRIVSNAIGYGIVTVVLFAVFVTVNLLLVAVFSQAVAGLEGNGIAVAGATLVAAALFTPVRHRVQRAVDHRFHRARYDAERTVASLAARLRDEVDVARLRDDIVDVVTRSVEPTRAELWLRQGMPR
jgi:hypothetical protein